jgi:GDPmannose 4,6-dehydratase
VKTALICGVTGQDGAYLADFLLKQGYKVYGTSRDPALAKLNNLDRIGVRDQIEMISMAPTDFGNVLAAIQKTRPDEIYALAGQSSVGLSFEMPKETLESIVFGALNILEAVRLVDRSIRVYHAGSSECFGDLQGKPATETTSFRPRSPYGVAKTSAVMLVANYREAYSLFAVNGLLFNHESPLRPERFVTRKITAGAARIAGGSGERLQLGHIDIVRDWGWAPEYVEAMWKMLQHDDPQDFIIATGKSVPLASFVETAFAHFGLDWRDHVDSSDSFGRPSDLQWSGADPGKADALLGWRAELKMPDVAIRMAEAESQADNRVS